MTLKYLPDHYMNRLLGCNPKSRTLADELTIVDRLKPFALDSLEDKNEITCLPLPEDSGTVREELEKAYAAYDNRWQSIETLVYSDAPKIPSSFYCPIGWSYWDESEQLWCKIAHFPKGRVFVLDAETVEVAPGIWHPTCMVAMSSKGWLVWKADLDKINTVSVVPFGTDNDIIGYNISYDRSYLDVEYRYQTSGNQFYDLMSMWIVTNGMSNQQRSIFSKFDKAPNNDDDYLDFNKPAWLQKTSTNGLASAYKFYTGKELDKGVRDGIVDGALGWVSENMEAVIRYCALDVLATHELSQYLLPAYKLQRPSKINRYGAVALGSCWLPLSADRFPSFYDRVEGIYQADKAELNELLMQASADFLAANPQGNDQTATLDWTLAKTGKNKGLPKWYRDNLSSYNAYKTLLKLTDKVEKGGLSLGQLWAPLVLGMTFGGHPVLWDGKGFTAAGVAIAHPTKRGQAVASMFLKDFSGLYDSGFIQVADYVKTLLEIKTSSINWVSTRKRIGAIRTEFPDGYPVTIPQMSVNGTVTGRATDPIWQVTANPKQNRIGTELKSMVAPYPGYSFVGADVDSQEAWLAACHGDEDLGFCASTPFSLMTIAGSSKYATDIHSVVARETGYSRDVTKTRVYGALYGQGVKGDSVVIMQANPNLSVGLANVESVRFVSLFKGQKAYASGRAVLNKATYRGGIASQAFTRMEKLADLKQPRTPLTGAYMSKALAGLNDYKPTRVNWIVQSSGVDFRDMLVIMTKYFYKRFGVDGRLVLTIHDELRSMVKDCDITKAVYALQLAHLYVRAAFVHAHKLDNIPAGVAWFSAVDVDSVCLRKDPSDPQITPTQTALPLGYTMNPQQLMDVLRLGAD